MDLDDFTPTDTPQPLQLIDPRTGVELESDGKPVLLLILGPDHPTMLGIERTIQSRRLKNAQRSGRVNVTVEEIEAELIERVAGSIAGWANVSRGGKPLPYSKEAARALVTDLIWIREQVDGFYRDRGNFMAASEKTSKPR